MKQTIILLYGGRSAEREVSVLSAESVMRAVNYDRFTVKTFFISQSGDFIKTQEFSHAPGQEDRLMTNETIDWDKKVAPSAIYEEGAVVFPVLHGPMGEDGSVQGFLEVLKMPYVGCNILSSSLAMDKITTKRVLESAGIAQVPYVAIVEGDDVTAKIAEVEEKLAYPVFTKPSNMGSSVGISKSENQEELRQALKLAFRYDSRVLVEQGVNAREIEVGLLGNYDVKSTLPGEVVKDVAFMTTMPSILITRLLWIFLPKSVMMWWLSCVKMQKQPSVPLVALVYLVAISSIQIRERFFSTSSIPCQVLPSGLCTHYFGTIWGSATQN